MSVASTPAILCVSERYSINDESLNVLHATERNRFSLSRTIDEKPQEWRSGYLLKLFYLVGAAGAAITTYLVYRAYFRPDAVDFEE